MCFEISLAFRRKGVATALLQRVIDDAMAEGYIAVESFPVIRDKEYKLKGQNGKWAFVRYKNHKCSLGKKHFAILCTIFADK